MSHSPTKIIWKTTDLGIQIRCHKKVYLQLNSDSARHGIRHNYLQSPVASEHVLEKRTDPSVGAGTIISARKVRKNWTVTHVISTKMRDPLSPANFPAENCWFRILCVDSLHHTLPSVPFSVGWRTFDVSIGQLVGILRASRLMQKMHKKQHCSSPQSEAAACRRVPSHCNQNRTWKNVDAYNQDPKSNNVTNGHRHIKYTSPGVGRQSERLRGESKHI